MDVGDTGDMIYVRPMISGDEVGMLRSPSLADATRYAVTIYDKTGPLCCFGITSPWAGYGVAWFLERDPLEVGRHSVGVGRHVVSAFGLWTRETAYRRLDAFPPLLHCASCRLVERLGFSYEGQMPGYGIGGETHLRYVWFPEGR